MKKKDLINVFNDIADKELNSKKKLMCVESGCRNKPVYKFRFLNRYNVFVCKKHKKDYDEWKDSFTFMGVV